MGKVPVFKPAEVVSILQRIGFVDFAYIKQSSLECQSKFHF